MNPRDQLTLQAIFEEPPQEIEWEAIEDLLIAAGCRVVRESKDRVGFERDGIIGSFQRPADFNKTLDFSIRAVREYLVRIGVIP